MGQPVPDERYEDIILQAIPAEYERVRTASYERRDFHLADIRRMMSAPYIDCLSRPYNSPLVAGRGVAMQATGGDDSAIKCHYCGNPGHRQKIVSPGLRLSAKMKISKRLGQHRQGAGKRKQKEMASRCGARSTSPPRTVTRHAVHYNNNWATTVAQVVPTRGRTTPLSSLQAILLPVVILRSKAYRSMQSKCRPGTNHQNRRASGRSVPPVKRLPRSTPAGFSAALKAPSAKRPSTRKRRHRELGPTSLVP